jgi:predicted amidohydrolase
MHWTLERNLAEVLAALDEAAAEGAAGCVCTELALTGFHRRVPELLDARALAAAETQLRAACARLGIAAVVGLPTLAEHGHVFNSHVYIDAAGSERGRVHKRGLTASEAGFFAPGGRRGWVALGGVMATSVLCREMLDVDALLPELRAAWPPGADGPRVVCWPSYIGESDAGQTALTAAYRQGAVRLARELSAWVLQSNWAASLNAPGAQGLGDSLVIDPDGMTVAQLPRDASACHLVALKAPAQARRISAA